ncbi:unnamed protein product, partial [Candidula unifasciata]
RNTNVLHRDVYIPHPPPTDPLYSPESQTDLLIISQRPSSLPLSQFSPSVASFSHFPGQ